MRLLVLLEQEFAEVHDAAHGRISGGRHLDQIQLGALRHLQCLETSDHADLMALGVDHPQLRRTDLVVTPNALSNRGSDTSYLQNNPAAARDFLGKSRSDRVHRHRSEIFAIARAHGQGI